MAEIQIFILSIIQGITEFLPISSSAHLLLTSKLLLWTDQGLTFDVMVHIGTLGAVLLYFHKEIYKCFKGFLALIFFQKSPNKHLLMMLIIASLPIMIIGYLAVDFIEYALRTSNIVKIIAITSIIFGIFLWMIDMATPTYNRIEHLTIRTALIIGIAQTLALIPGVSRAGITMTAGRLIGMEREQTAYFSMLLSIPTILGAAALLMYKGYESKTILLSNPILIAMALSFVSAFLAIHVLLAWLKKSTMLPFALYRIGLGIFLLLYIN